MTLAHEMGHALQHLSGALNGHKNENSVYLIEMANLRTIETPIAQELGEPTRDDYYDARGVMDMQSVTHYRTTYKRPWWEYIFPWNWGEPSTVIADHLGN